MVPCCAFCLQAEAEESGAAFAYNAPVLGVRRTPAGLFHVEAGEWPGPDSPEPSTQAGEGSQGVSTEGGNSSGRERNGSDQGVSSEDSNRVMGSENTGNVLGRRAPSPSLVLEAQLLVNAAGLSAVPLAHRTQGFPKGAIPRRHLARGHYFSLASWKPPPPFSRLIYPMPEEGGIGIHVTLDLAGGLKFGPDVQWLPPIPDDDLFCT